MTLPSPMNAVAAFAGVRRPDSGKALHRAPYAISEAALLIPNAFAAPFTFEKANGIDELMLC